MSLPTNYTYTTFADYLRDEVLMDTSMELGWLDIVDLDNLPPAQPKATDVVTTYGGPSTDWDVYKSYNNLLRAEGRVFIVNDDAPVANVRQLSTPSEYDIPAGTLISFPGVDDPYPGKINSANWDTFEVATDVDIGDTEIEFTTANNLNSTRGLGYFYAGYTPPTIDPVDRVINPVYAYITDATLLEMGATDITAITSLADKRKLRTFGRVECWKVAMQSLASDYSYSTPSNLGSSRFEVYQHCTAMYDYESSRKREEYAHATIENVQEVLTTVKAKVVPKW